MITTPPSQAHFTIVNDGSTDDSNKLGAIGDLHLVLTREKVDDDIIVVAGDNLFSEPLTDFGRFLSRQAITSAGRLRCEGSEQIKKYNAITLAPDGRITFFEEKPKTPSAPSPALLSISTRATAWPR